VNKLILVMVAAAVMSAAGTAQGSSTSVKSDKITQEELVRRAQEIADAVAPGNQEPFKKYFADDALYFDEKGRGMDKAALVKDVQPLPKGYSGTIKVVNPKSHIEGDVAILSYDQDEVEIVFGQKMTARYHETDTWMRRNGQWQIIAAQVLRYYEDPAEGQYDPKLFPNFVGSYQLGENTMTVTSEDGKLFAQRTGRAKVQMLPEAPDVFFLKGVEGRRLFQYGPDGKVDSLIDRRNNEDLVWKRVSGK
jgi:hypothetical protein